MTDFYSIQKKAKHMKILKITSVHGSKPGSDKFNFLNSAQQGIDALRNQLAFICMILLLAVVTACEDTQEQDDPAQIRMDTLATGLAAPLGVAPDNQGRVWIGEVAAGQVSVITPDGKKYPAITGFTVGVSPENLPDGLNHLLYKDGKLYILHGVDEKLYIADVAAFKPGDQPLAASQLACEPIGQVVLDSLNSKDPLASNLYNMAFGPDGDLYIADAGANAIIRRSKTGKVSIFAAIPGVSQVTPSGTSTVESVPTGIVFDGEKFWVTILTGFPFPAGKARIYQVDLTGKVMVYQEGFSSLVDIVLQADGQPLVLQIAEAGQQGYLPNTGRLLQVKNGQISTVLQELNFPTSIKRGPQANTYYINSLAGGTLMRITY